MRMTATQYMKELFGKYMSEKDAVDLLIKSHANQRAIIVEDGRKWMNSKEGKEWEKKVEAMSLSECIDWMKKVREEE
jgi:hypothetical protein